MNSCAYLGDRCRIYKPFGPKQQKIRFPIDLPNLTLKVSYILALWCYKEKQYWQTPGGLLEVCI